MSICHVRDKLTGGPSGKNAGLTCGATGGFGNCGTMPAEYNYEVKTSLLLLHFLLKLITNVERTIPGGR